MRPLIGVTCDADAERTVLREAYARAVADAGGLPILLPPEPSLAADYVARCHAIVLSGGDDPLMETFGETTDPRATPVQPRRQAFELALLDALASARERPALGICLGMQYMALHAGGALDQHLPDTLPSHAAHWGRVEHPVEVMLHGRPTRGAVLSHHRQAVRTPGSLAIAGRSPDGLIECIVDPDRPFYVGVQWHPERTAHPPLGAELFRRLVAAARAGAAGFAFAPEP